MVKQIQGAGGAKPVRKATKTQDIKTAQKTSQSNVQMQRDKTDAYIETESYLQNCKNRWYGFTGNHGSNATKEENEKYAKWQRLNNVVNKTDYIINDDGSVRFVFKDSINVEDFKEVFEIGDGYLRDYLKTKHENGLKDGTVHAQYTNGAKTEAEQRAVYNSSGNGAVIRYSDGYIETKGPKGGWFNRSKIVDHPDYRGMTLGPSDNEKLFTFGQSFFDPYKD